MRGVMVVAGRVGLVVAMLVGVAACGVFVPAPKPSSAYTVSVAPGLHPRMAAADAVSVTHGYLDEQTPELAVPGMHVPANVTHVWAVTATDARALDPCIRSRTPKTSYGSRWAPETTSTSELTPGRATTRRQPRPIQLSGRA